MVVTIPRMGNICLAAKAFFEAMGIAYVMPEKISAQMLLQGAALSPEEICLPFKIFMGGYADCIQKGADTILITGSCGPCRFGEYCELQVKQLAHHGLAAKTIVLDAPRVIGMRELLRRAGTVSGDGSAAKKLCALRQALHILSLADNIDRKARARAGYEAHPGDFKKALHTCHARAEDCRDPDEMRQTLRRYERRMDCIALDMRKKPLRVALIGEIYSMIEPFANLFIEDILMELGVCSSRMITPTWWLKDLALKPLRLNSPSVGALSKRYLPCNAGGHARESISHALLCKKHGFDGAIQIYPLGCMPEIVVKAILPSIQAGGFPVLTLVIDEVTGEAGYLTRIEAFIDMLAARRKRESRTA